MIGDDPLPSLSARRSYPAPPDLVFRALTEAGLLQRWFAPSADVAMTVAELDLRVGGRYRFVFHFSERTAVVVGEYRVVSRPHRLAFTWTWEPPDPHASINTLVTIDLTDNNGSTELTLTHAGFPSEEVMRQHDAGWAVVLDRLLDLTVRRREGTLWQ